MHYTFALAVFKAKGYCCLRFYQSDFLEKQEPANVVGGAPSKTFSVALGLINESWLWSFVPLYTFGYSLCNAELSRNSAKLLR